MSGRAFTGPSNEDWLRANGLLVPCPAHPERNESCPVWGGRSTFAHEHDATLLALSIERNEAIHAAIAKFKVARDRLAKKLSGPLYREAMRRHERELDKAKHAAWSAFSAATGGES